MIQFDFFETFDENDVVYVYDGNDIDRPLIVSLNGSYETPPGPWTTTQRVMFLMLRTDATNHARGFSAIVRSVSSG
jgi:CUB domain